VQSLFSDIDLSRRVDSTDLIGSRNVSTNNK